MTSVNTNFGALVALQNLNYTNKELSTVQSRINTGLKVANARDDGAVYAIAQNLRARTSSLGAINEGIGRASTNIDNAVEAGGRVATILNELKASAERAATFTSAADRQAAQDSFAAARDKIDTILNSATINGVNLINGTNAAEGLSVATSDVGDTAVRTVQQVRGAVADNGLVFSSTANDLSAATVIADAASGAVNVTNQIFVATGDRLRFNLIDSAGATTETIDIVISDYATVGALQAGVEARTGGRVNLTFSGDQLSYDSDQNFTVSFYTGVATADGAGNVNDELTTRARIAFFTGATSTIADGVAAGNVADSLATSAARQVDGGKQVATSALAAGTTTATLASTLLNTGSTPGSVTITTVSSVGAGNQNAYTLNIEEGETLGQFLSKVSERTGGEVTAAFDTDTRQIVYRGASTLTSLTIANTNGTAFGSATASTNTQVITRVASSSASAIVAGYDFRVAGGELSALASLDLTTDPATAKTTIEALAATLTAALGNLGAQGKALETQQSFLTTLSDNIEKGIGSLVDADLAKESARLQSLQVKQQLGAQALSIANQAPQILLSFFR